jgi:hypothetical protein
MSGFCPIFVTCPRVTDAHGCCVSVFSLHEMSENVHIKNNAHYCCLDCFVCCFSRNVKFTLALQFALNYNILLNGWRGHDAVTGAATVIEAMGAGKGAARGIQAYIAEKRMKK